MENTIEQTNPTDQIYAFAADQMVRQQKNSYQVKTALLEQGLSEANAAIVVENLEKQIEQARKTKSNKDMLYGALWAVGGIIVTSVSMASGKGGVIAWGAILFGGIQFVRGIINSMK